MRSNPLNVEQNDPRRAGESASQRLSFGRLYVYAVHTHFGEVEWLVVDVEQTDEITGCGQVIRQARTLEAAVDGLDECQQLRPYILAERERGSEVSA